MSDKPSEAAPDDNLVWDYVVVPSAREFPDESRVETVWRGAMAEAGAAVEALIRGEEPEGHVTQGPTECRVVSLASLWGESYTRWSRRAEDVLRHLDVDPWRVGSRAPNLDELLDKAALVVEALPEPEMDKEGYEELSRILVEAFNQTARGKGHDRHGHTGRRWVDQSINAIPRMQACEDGLVYQICKKATEAAEMDPRAQYTEALGIIGYAAALAHWAAQREVRDHTPDPREYGCPQGTASTQVRDAVRKYQEERGHVSGVWDAVNTTATSETVQGEAHREYMRGDHLIVDDPHGSDEPFTQEQQREAVQAWLGTLPAHMRLLGKMTLYGRGPVGASAPPATTQQEARHLAGQSAPVSEWPAVKWKYAVGGRVMICETGEVCPVADRSVVRYRDGQAGNPIYKVNGHWYSEAQLDLFPTIKEGDRVTVPTGAVKRVKSITKEKRWMAEKKMEGVWDVYETEDGCHYIEEQICVVLPSDRQKGE